MSGTLVELGGKQSFNQGTLVDMASSSKTEGAHLNSFIEKRAVLNGVSGALYLRKLRKVCFSCSECRAWPLETEKTEKTHFSCFSQLFCKTLRNAEQGRSSLPEKSEEKQEKCLFQCFLVFSEIQTYRARGFKEAPLGAVLRKESDLTVPA